MEDNVNNNLYKYNADQQQFYRVAYPKEHLMCLARNSEAACLSMQDRMGLIAYTSAW
jgi:hypothetical protein